ncbi:hypothetical protein JAAARDRAFT_194586 [Jaapia argillacea MUCL 33604]|uniref:Uncharacterized protein n=1 Tax=Jaapia argillacea MUCL 33604 TaxID=933084 RepID=A0A067PRY2_9AGAM|nr:hypothetical protein JAAARDRAFT_194586 [Jaapia argillacea MUCL 33604]
MPDTGFYTIENTVNGSVGLGAIVLSPTSPPSSRLRTKSFVISIPSTGGYHITAIATSAGFLPQPRESTVKDQKLFARVATGVDEQLWYVPQNPDGSVQITVANGGGSWVLASNKAGTQVDCRTSTSALKTSELAAADFKDMAFWKLTKANISSPPPTPPGPLESGKYTIKNVKYGNINISSGSSNVKVVSNSNPATWFVERIDKKGFVYQVSLVQESSPLNGRQAVDAAGLLYISDSNLITANWVIHPLQNKNNYMRVSSQIKNLCCALADSILECRIFRDSMTVGPAHWGIDNANEGTQVGVRFEDHALQHNVVDNFLTADECFWEIVKAA